MIAIALDGSGSMAGTAWKNVVNGAKLLIDHVKNHHAHPN